MVIVGMTKQTNMKTNGGVKFIGSNGHPLMGTYKQQKNQNCTPRKCPRPLTGKVDGRLRECVNYTVCMRVQTGFCQGGRK